MFKCYCRYCATKTYLWKLHGYLWVEIPKNASTSIKRTNRVEQISIDRIKTFDKGFLVLREPLNRFKSMISHYFVDGYRNVHGHHWLKKQGYTEWSNETLVDMVLDNWDNLKDISEPHHFNTQKSFIPNEVWDIPNLVVYDMNDNIPFIEVHENKSKSEEINLSEYQEKKVKELYSDDIELYNHQILYKKKWLN